MCYDEVGTYVGSNMSTIDDFIRKRIFTLTSYNCCISILILKFEMTISMICTGRDNAHTNSRTIKIVCGVGSDHNGATLYISS